VHRELDPGPSPVSQNRTLQAQNADPEVRVLCVE
jgi:hypothetical protein